MSSGLKDTKGKKLKKRKKMAWCLFKRLGQQQWHFLRKIYH